MIQWYPGHMVTAKKDAVIALRKTDVVIEVLDARVPKSSCNPQIEVIRREHQRPSLKILNKVDIADPEQTKLWLAYYDAIAGTKAIAISAKKAGDVAKIPKECLALAPGRGVKGKPLRLMILGIPNVGKSTLMNTLLKRHVANVGDEPAVTKHHMGHALGNNMWLVDTPGLMWPGVPEATALRLAATHSIGRNAYDEDTVAYELGAYLMQHYRPAIEKRYGGLPEGDLLAWIAKQRSFVAKGGAPDLRKAATVFLQDFRTGLLGRVTLETP